MIIGFGISAVNFATSGAFFVATSFDSSGSQKKENSESGFGCRDAIDAVIFDRDATSLVSSASGFQKKERSETGFRRRVTARTERTMLGVDEVRDDEAVGGVAAPDKRDM